LSLERNQYEADNKQSFVCCWLHAGFLLCFLPASSWFLALFAACFMLVSSFVSCLLHADFSLCFLPASCWFLALFPACFMLVSCLAYSLTP
jgi:hypothetical protein